MSPACAWADFGHEKEPPMTPAPVPARPVDRLEQLEQLETSDRIRYHGRPATVLEVNHGATIGGNQAALLIVLFDSRDAEQVLVASPENLHAFEILPPPRIYQETPA